MYRFLLLSCLMIATSLQSGFSQCNGLPTDCTGTQSGTADPMPTNGTYNAGTVVTFCYSMQNYNQCNSNWFHTLNLTFGPGWDLSTLTPITIPASCDGLGNWNFYNSVTSTATGQTFGPCFSYDSPLGFIGNVLDGNPGNNFGDNCTTHTWTFCFSIMVAAGSFNQSLSVDAKAIGDGTAGSWTSNTCPGAWFNLCNAFSQACFLDASGVIAQPSCLDNDGSITLTVTGNIGPVSYQWNPGAQTTAAVNGLSSGTYDVIITDSVNCTIGDTFELAYVNPLVTSFTITPAKCFGYCDGIASVFVTNGSAPYTYDWSTTGGTASYDSALCAGTYYVTVSDADYCTKIDTLVVTSPSEIQLVPILKDVSCYGGHDGWATMDASGGSNIFFFNWQPGGQNGDTAKFLFAGTYTVTATDTKGCFADTTFTLTSPPQIIITPDIFNVSCYGLNDGSITTMVSQGVAPYQYLWVNNNQTGTAISNLAAGIYPLLVTDASGCQELDTFYVTQPDTLTGIFDITAPGCPSAENGVVTAVVEGGTLPYQYEWNNNALLSTSMLSGIAQGNYSLLVTDANGCLLTIAEYVKALPDLVIHAGLDVSIELGERTILNAEVDRIGDFDFEWKPPYNLTDSLQWSTYAYPYHTTTYTVEVTDPVSGCKGTDSVTVIILPASYVFVPSGFSPNNDGLNDKLFPVYGDLVVIESFKIFNRWGQVVFSSKTEGWDGTFKGKPEATATYVYSVSYRIEGRPDQTFTKSGSTTLIR